MEIHQYLPLWRRRLSRGGDGQVGGRQGGAPGQAATQACGTLRCAPGAVVAPVAPVVGDVKFYMVYGGRKKHQNYGYIIDIAAKLVYKNPLPLVAEFYSLWWIHPMKTTAMP